MILRIANGVMFVLFVSWAGFQYNDPDAILWIIVYGLAAFGCLLFFLDRFSHPAAWSYVFLCVAGTIYLAVRVIAKHEFIFDEQGREMIGLLISAGWIAFLSRRVTAASARKTDL